MSPQTGGRFRVVSVVGTRPEVIKMAPVIHELSERSADFEQWVVATGQHRELLDQVCEACGVLPDVDLDLMEPDQSLAGFAARCLDAVAGLLDEIEPHAVLVQGDTTTVFVTALAAFYRNVLIGHVEAGLRSHDRRNPFPEEINRRLAGCVADLHFAPTDGARRNLLAEGVGAESIVVTGNTIVDSLSALPDDGPPRCPELAAIDFERRPVVLVTAHRRENHGAPLRSICDAIATLSVSRPELRFVIPVHPNPNVRVPIEDALSDCRSAFLVPPLDYLDLLRVMRRSHLILTDSGGVQEEAPSFGKPVLVLREVTERPELVDAGLGALVGTNSERIVAAVERLLDDPAAYAAMANGTNPFGDGRAASRIVDALSAALERRTAGLAVRV